VKMEFKHRIPYVVQIGTAMPDGFKVAVGCATLFYTDPLKLCNDLRDYLTNPDKAITAHKEHTDGDPDRVDQRHAPASVTIPGPTYPVARCHCGADLDAMGRCIGMGGEQTPGAAMGDRLAGTGSESPHGSGGGPIPRGAERLGRRSG